MYTVNRDVLIQLADLEGKSDVNPLWTCGEGTSVSLYCLEMEQCTDRNTFIQNSKGPVLEDMEGCNLL